MKDQRRQLRLLNLSSLVIDAADDIYLVRRGRPAMCGGSMRRQGDDP